MSSWVSLGALKITSAATQPNPRLRRCRLRRTRLPRMFVSRRRELRGTPMKRIAFILTAALSATCGFAQSTPPATNGAVEHLKAKVTGVEGIVQVRMADDQPWQMAKVGMEVG